MEVFTYIGCMYGLCKGNSTPKIAEHKVEYPILGTETFGDTTLRVSYSNMPA